MVILNVFYHPQLIILMLVQTLKNIKIMFFAVIRLIFVHKQSSKPYKTYFDEAAN